MPIQWTIDEEGKPVIKDGKVVLNNDQTGQVWEVDPAQSHASYLALSKDLPERNEEIKRLKATLAKYDDVNKAIPDLVENPSAVLEKLQRLQDLEASGEKVEKSIANIRLENAETVAKMKAEYKAMIEGYEKEVARMKESMIMDSFLIPWATDPILNEYRIPRNSDAIKYILLESSDWGKKMVFEGKDRVIGADGLPLQDTKPSAVLRHILDNHPKAHEWKLSNMPAGTNVGTSATAAGGVEKHFQPVTYNLTEQLKLKSSNPELYLQLSNKYALTR
jgi:hypothetical protein